MPFSAATWSMMENLISQDSTASGISATGRSLATALAYGFAAACRLATWESSEDRVIRWLPTIAAAPTCTGEQAASTAHAPRPTAPAAATRRPLFLLVKRV